MCSSLAYHQPCTALTTRKSRTLHPYFTPVAASLSAKVGKTFDVFLARSRNAFSGVGTTGVEVWSAIVVIE